MGSLRHPTEGLVRHSFLRALCVGMLLLTIIGCGGGASTGNNPPASCVIHPLRSPVLHAFLTCCERDIPMHCDREGFGNL